MWELSFTRLGAVLILLCIAYCWEICQTGIKDYGLDHLENYLENRTYNVQIIISGTRLLRRVPQESVLVLFCFAYTQKKGHMYSMTMESILSWLQKTIPHDDKQY